MSPNIPMIAASKNEYFIWVNLNRSLGCIEQSAFTIFVAINIFQLNVIPFGERISLVLGILEFLKNLANRVLAVKISQTTNFEDDIVEIHQSAGACSKICIRYCFNRVTSDIIELVLLDC